MLNMQQTSIWIKFCTLMPNLSRQLPICYLKKNSYAKDYSYFTMWNYKILTASKKASTSVMLFKITTPLPRVASVRNSLWFCLRLIGHGNILACSPMSSTSLALLLLLIQRGSLVLLILTSSSMADMASSSAIGFSCSIRPLEKGVFSDIGGGAWINSGQDRKGSLKCLE